MAAKSYSRGHEIIHIDGLWVYADNHEPINNYRPCKKCGQHPTLDGYDACLGNIEGVTSACCGHGVQDKYIKYADGRIEREKAKLISEGKYLIILISIVFILPIILIVIGVAFEIKWAMITGTAIFILGNTWNSSKLGGTGPK